jgi:hypothetical protein
MPYLTIFCSVQCLELLLMLFYLKSPTKTYKTTNSVWNIKLCLLNSQNVTRFFLYSRNFVAFIDIFCSKLTFEWKKNYGNIWYLCHLAWIILKIIFLLF